jgi:methionine--tRNA ligase beta chain
MFGILMIVISVIIWDFKFLVIRGFRYGKLSNLKGEECFMASIEDFGKLELKIAEIVEVELHPNADRLYVLKVKIGEEIRQIVAGIRKFYGVDELKGKKVVVVSNLDPAVIRGVESQGMLLAASDTADLTLVTPERPITLGARVK